MRNISSFNANERKYANTDTNIANILPMTTPRLLKHHIPISKDIQNVVHTTREHIKQILNHTSYKKMVIVGPCSIHDTKAAMDYANRLANVQVLYPNLLLIMRVYFEKPRTVTGWKGLIMDPELDNSCKIEQGLCMARQLLVDINSLGVPVGCEFLDTISAQYFDDLVSWGAIGARTVESQLHRQLASGLSTPIGFKNSTSGDIDVAIHSILSSKESHTFLGINSNGNASVVQTKGNPNCHIILRGGQTPNYFKHNVDAVSLQCISKGVQPNIMIDCSHGNSQKNYTNQHRVLQSVCAQLQQSKSNIIGVMIESNIHAGKQNLIQKEDLIYGVSITDACIDWEETVIMLNELNQNCL